jgi:hypothetical protein
MAHYNEPDLKTQLQNLLANLLELGKELPQCLFSLTQIVQPQIPNEMRMQLINNMFTEVPSVLQSVSPHQLNQLIHQPRSDTVGFRLLLDICQVQQILQNLSYLQLLHLSNNLIPPGSPQQQLDFLVKIQEHFQSWSNQTLKQYHEALLGTPLHLERQRLLQFEPQIPTDCLHVLIDLLKLPLEELQHFKQWIDSLHRDQLIILVNLLQLEPAVLVEIKRRITTNVSTPGTSLLGEGESSLSGTKRSRYGNPKSASIKASSSNTIEYEDALELLNLNEHPSKRYGTISTHVQHTFSSSEESSLPTSFTSFNASFVPSTQYYSNIETNNINNTNNINPLEWDLGLPPSPPLMGTEILPELRDSNEITENFINRSTPPHIACMYLLSFLIFILSSLFSLFFSPPFDVLLVEYCPSLESSFIHSFNHSLLSFTTNISVLS